MDKDLIQIIDFLTGLQTQICQTLESLDGKSEFIEDNWIREEGGGGKSNVIQDGAVFEKGGVNFSHVFGQMPDILKTAERNAGYFHATGLSIVIHPNNPFVPIIHMNVRYFKMSDKENGPIKDQWFGGGIDLSPAYPNDEDTLHLHSILKSVCDTFDATYYPSYKKWCDDYFTIQHRNEMRGVGGIFYDHLRPTHDSEKERFVEFMKAVGNSFLPIYTEIVNRNKNKTYTDLNKEWQYIRRGRYAEFNLVYDRGTHFGLKTNGRIESILMSLPPCAEWKYNYQPEKNSPEYNTLSYFQPKHWN